MSKNNIVAIHQPNFFPWLGFFDKANRVDVFIFLDHVQQQKSGATWTNRVRLLYIDGEDRWFTVPIRHPTHGVISINDILIDDTKKWRQDLLKTLQRNYGRTLYYREVISLIEPLIFNDIKNLAEFNIFAIQKLMTFLELNPKIIKSSDLNIRGKSNELLILLTLAVGGTTYLCGDGADQYIDGKKFSATGVHLIYQNFYHPLYPQKNSKRFIPGLSIIDVLMNCGINHTKLLINKDINFII